MMIAAMPATAATLDAMSEIMSFSSSGVDAVVVEVGTEEGLAGAVATAGLAACGAEGRGAVAGTGGRGVAVGAGGAAGLGTLDAGGGATEAVARGDGTGDCDGGVVGVGTVVPAAGAAAVAGGGIVAVDFLIGIVVRASLGACAPGRGGSVILAVSFLGALAGAEAAVCGDKTPGGLGICGRGGVGTGGFGGTGTLSAMLIV